METTNLEHNTHTTTAAPTDTEPMTADALLSRLEKVRGIPALENWVLISPNGRVYSGRAEDVLLVLVAAHPLMNTRVEMMTFEDKED